MPHVKFAPSLLLIAIGFSLTACHQSTLATRRDLYSPTKGSGYWTERADGATPEEAAAIVAARQKSQARVKEQAALATPPL